MHENVYLSTFIGGNSAGRPLPRYGRIWPRSHMRGTCITPERLIECRMGEIVNFRRARKKAARQLAEGMHPPIDFGTDAAKPSANSKPNAPRRPAATSTATGSKRETSD